MEEGTMRGGIWVLCLNHLTGFVDLVILPIWVGVLVQHYHNSPQQAGALVSLFLIGQVLASFILSTRFDRLQQRRLRAFSGFGLAAVSMFGMVSARSFPAMVFFHLAAGLSVGVGLSLTDGTMGESENPHRLFAMASLSLGLFSVLFYVLVNPIIIARGGYILFYFLSLLMWVSGLSSLLAFPDVTQSKRKLLYESRLKLNGGRRPKLPSVVWFVVAGLMGMAMITAMASSFYERYGIASGYPPEKINLILLINGIVLLSPPILAALLQKAIKVKAVALAGLLFQALVVVLIYTSRSFTVYALPSWGVGFAAVFVHTFLFGYLAHLDPSGRVVAANPAVMMTGSMLGPFVGGSLVQYFGYASLAVFVLIWNALILLVCFRRILPLEGESLSVPLSA